jgi:hypothetical protein
MERVESIENLDGRVFYAQGIVSVDAFTAPFLRAEYRQTTVVGSARGILSSYP